MKKMFDIARRTILLLATIATCTSPDPAILAQQAGGNKANPFFTQQTVWNYMEDGYPVHQIQALIVSNRSTILTFTEGRLGAYDEDPKHILLKRSTDHGATWSDDLIIERSDGSYYNELGIPGKLEAWTNPAALVDQKTGRIFIFYALNEGSHHQRWTRVFYRYSDDDGLTWQPTAKQKGRIEITNLFKDNRHGWTFHMPGPGHGIQLTNQQGANAAKNGRLVLQVWNRRAVTERPRNYGVTVIYSDDHGKTWRRGGEAGMDYGMNESRLVELPSGQLVVNARGSDPEDNVQREDTKRVRLYAYSDDAGASFSSSTVRRELNYTNVDSSMIRYTPAPGRDCILFSHPSDPKGRSRMVVSVSCDGARTWMHHRLIDEGKVSYSDLVVLPDNTIAIVYGKRHAEGWLYRALSSSVAFARFNFEWLMQDQGEKQSQGAQPAGNRAVEKN